MLIAICGQRKAVSDKLSGLLKQYEKKDYTIVRIDSEQINKDSLLAHLQNQSIFSQKYIIVLQDLQKTQLNLILSLGTDLSSSANLFVVTCFLTDERYTKKLQKISNQFVLFKKKQENSQNGIFDLLFSLQKSNKIFFEKLKELENTNEQNVLGALFWYAKKSKNKSLILSVAKLNYNSKLQKDSVKNFLIKHKLSNCE